MYFESDFGIFFSFSLIVAHDSFQIYYTREINLMIYRTYLLLFFLPKLKSTLYSADKLNYRFSFNLISNDS